MDVTVLVELLSRFGFSGLLAGGVDADRLASVIAMACQSLGIRDRYVADEEFERALRAAIRRLDEPAPSPGFVVRGHIRNQLGAPLVRARVRALDQDLRTRQALGEATTDERGYYSIAYTRERFSRREKRTADIVIDVAPQVPPGPGFASELLWNAPAVAVIHLTSAPMTTRDTFTIISSQLESLLEATIEDGRPALRPEQLNEADVPLLVRETERSAVELSRFIDAHRFAIEIQCHASFIFACLMHGVSGPYERYVQTPASTHRDALLRGMAAMTIRPVPEAELEPRYLSLLRRAAARQVIDEQNPDNVLAPLWRRALADSNALDVFTAELANRDRSLKQTWAALEASPALASSLPTIRQLAKLSDATAAHVPLINALNERLILGQPAKPGDTPWSRFVALSRADLVRIVEQVGVPASVKGTDETKRRALYVEALDRTLDEVALPERLASRLTAQDAAEAEVAAFLKANPSFDMLAVADDATLARMSTGGRKKLQTLQRLARVIPRADLIVKILGKGFTSPEAIAAVPLPEFEATTKTKDGGGIQKDVHRNAHAATTLGAALTLERWIWGEKGSFGSQPATKPITLGSLFGSMDHCACDECSSVDGPAAYLVALWNVLTTEAKAALQTSRPDIPTLPLSCANTTTPLPTIDLALEVLEAAVQPGTVDRSTARTADELQAWPRTLRPEVYGVLADKTFPWALPFELETELVRSAVKELGATRSSLATLFRPLTNDPARLALEACEYFAVPTTEREKVFVPVSAAIPGVEVVLGIAAGVTEISMRDFLRRTHARFEELKIAAGVLGSDIELIRPDDCSLDNAVVRAKTTSALAQLARVLRLAYRTTLGIREVVAFGVVAASTVSFGDALVALWRACRWRDELDIALDDAIRLHHGDIGSDETLASALGLAADAFTDTVLLVGSGSSPGQRADKVIELAARLRAVGITATEARWLLGNPVLRSPGLPEATIDERIHALKTERETIEREQRKDPDAALDDAIEQLLARSFSVDRDVVARTLRDLGATLRTAITDVDDTGAITPASKTTARAALRAVERVAFVVRRFALDAKEIAVTVPTTGTSVWWTIDFVSGNPSTSVDGLLAVGECALLRRELPALPDKTPEPCDVVSSDLATALDAIAVACGWSKKAAGHLASAMSLTAASTPAEKIRVLAKIAALIERTHAWRNFLLVALTEPTDTDEQYVLVQRLQKLAEITRAPAVTLDRVRDALEAFLPASQRTTRTREIADQLRERCRDVLFAHLDSKRTEDDPTLFDQYLIDPLISACQRTSRVKSAIGSVQLFIQRALMYPASVPSVAEGTAATWKWMQNFRKWQANRKVFLYPENWIEPELRDNKTPLFQELEGALSQQDITTATVEAAYQQYLRGLHEVSRLEIVAIYTEEGAITADGRAGCATTHVVGRRWTQPRTHYYRQRHGGVWTAWEKLDADIEGDHVIVTVHAGRPMILWGQIREGRSTNLQERKSSGSKATSAEQWPPWEIRLSWIVRVHGHWRTKQTLDPDMALRVGRIADWETYEDETETDNDKKTKKRIVPSSPVPLEKERFAFVAHPDDKGPLRITVFYGSRFLDKTEHTSGVFEIGVCGRETHLPSNMLPSLQMDTANLWPLNPISDENPGLLGFTGSSVGDSRRSSSMNGMTQLEVHVDSVGNARLLTRPTTDPVQTFRVVIQPRSNDDFFFGDFDSRPFVYQNDLDTLFIERSKPGRTVNRSPSLTKNATAAARQVSIIGKTKWGSQLIGDNNAPDTSEPPTPEPELPYFRVWMFEHQHACRLLEASNRDKLDNVLAPAMQLDAIDPPRKETFDSYYLKAPHQVTSPRPTDRIEFDPSSPHAIYNWELFFHVPFFIAVKLMQNERFEEALGYLHLIFDPAGPGTDESSRIWRFTPFRPNLPGSAVDLLKALESGKLGDAETAVVGSTIASYRNDAFNPHLIARIRPSAYMRAVVMRYLDCLIGWGDQLFGRLTLESLNQATLMYMTAARLLGKRPTTLPRKPIEPTPTLATLVAPAGVGVNLGDVGPGCDVDDSQPSWPSFDFEHFCPPPNEKALAYWDTLDDRLFKLRNCQDLEGNVVALPLFEPPIDPALLVRAAAAGVDISLIQSDLRLPAYRFSVVLQKALELCNDVRALGAELQTAIEKRDAEALARLRQGHEISTLDAARAIRKGQAEEARQAVAALEKQRDTVELRRRHYQEDLQRRNSREEQAQKHGEKANALNLAQGVFESIAGIFHVLPTLNLGSVSFATWGSPFIAAALQATARNLAAGASLESYRASRAQTEAGYDRRAEEWSIQGRLAASELLQLEKQLVAAEIRLAIAERELENHDRLRDNARSIDAQMRTRFSNLELFDWMVRQSSAAYYHAFRQALEMANKAQKCFQMERGILEEKAPKKTRSFIGTAQWDDLRQGLLAGHRLHRELRQMEIAYLDENKRDLELTKHISVNQIDATALMMLRATGRCSITLSEALFDYDFPLHYQRRLKAVAVTIPAITGPHTNVNATLTLESSQWRTKPRDEVSDPQATTIGVGSSIATSSGQNDGGMFEVNLRDERYLPFEGAGADSTWSLELPTATNALDRDSITDVILHLRYTALDTDTPRPSADDPDPRRTLSDAILAKVKRPPMTRLFSLRHDFAREWAMATRSGTFSVSLDLAPFAPRSLTTSTQLRATEIYAEGASTSELEGKVRASSQLDFVPVDGSHVQRAAFSRTENVLSLTIELPNDRIHSIKWFLVATFT